MVGLYCQSFRRVSRPIVLDIETGIPRMAFDFVPSSRTIFLLQPA